MTVRKLDDSVVAFEGCAMWMLLVSILAQDGPLPFDASKYEAKERFVLEAAEIQPYVKAEAGPAWMYFLVRPKKGSSRLYRVDKDPQRLAVFLHADGAPSPRVLTRRMPQATYDDARKQIELAETSLADWDAHKTFLDLACSTSADTARQGWQKIAANLERAHEKHPEHLGILRDLVVAYSRLFTLETETSRGTNLCTLIPDHITEYTVAAGALTRDEELTFRRTLALLYFEIGLYPIAKTHIEKAPDDPQMATLRKAMEGLGQYAFRTREEFEVKGETATYTVTVYEAESPPSDGKMIFHLWTFVTRPDKDSTAPGQVWYTLSNQTLKDAPRYYLYGRTANLKNVLALYGRQQPAYDEVKTKVTELMADALKKGK